MTGDVPSLLISRLAYLGVAATDLRAWSHYARAVMGIHVDERPDRLRLRLDAKFCRILVQPETWNGANFFGWEVADGMALDDAAARLRGAGVTVEWGDATASAERGVSAFLWFTDPLGNREGADRRGPYLW